MTLLVRAASPADEADLARIDLATWTTASSPAPPPAAGEYTFFGERSAPGDVLVAELDGRVAGYVKLRPQTPLPSNTHVLQVGGLAVDPALHGRGAGRALVEAAVRAARERGARKLTLRVLGSNTTARRLYERCGFVVEGVLEREWLLDGAWVDDVLMAVHLDRAGSAATAAPWRAGLSIPPDTKDWTWVLASTCPECGLDSRTVGLADVPAALRGVVPAFASVLAGVDAARRRPDLQVWSPLEYACHVRDVARRFDTRLHLMLTEDEPRFEDWDQDAAAVQGRYAEQDPVRVAAEVEAAVDRLAAAFEAVPSGAEQRAGYRSDGARFTVETLGRYLVHDLVHHVHDVSGGSAGGVSR